MAKILTYQTVKFKNKNDYIWRENSVVVFALAMHMYGLLFHQMCLFFEWNKFNYN